MIWTDEGNFSGQNCCGLVDWYQVHSYHTHPTSGSNWASRSAPEKLLKKPPMFTKRQPESMRQTWTTKTPFSYGISSKPATQTPVSSLDISCGLGNGGSSGLDSSSRLGSWFVQPCAITKASNHVLSRLSRERPSWPKYVMLAALYPGKLATLDKYVRPVLGDLTLNDYSDIYRGHVQNP